MIEFIGMLLAGQLTWVPVEPTGPSDDDHQVQMPVNDIVQAGGRVAATAWTAVGSNRTRPALSYYEAGRPAMVLTCEGNSTNVQVRGFTPKQAWPQPEMMIRLGDVTRSASPDVRNIGTQVAYEFHFGIADEVLQQIAVSAPITVDFNGETRTFPSPPDDLRRSFTDGCVALVPPGMRASGADVPKV